MPKENPLSITDGHSGPEVTLSRREDGWEPVEVVRGKENSFTLRSIELTIPVADLFAV